MLKWNTEVGATPSKLKLQEPNCPLIKIFMVFKNSTQEVHSFWFFLLNLFFGECYWGVNSEPHTC
jgi:hypothetical protein